MYRGKGRKIVKLANFTDLPQRMVNNEGLVDIKHKLELLGKSTTLYIYIYIDLKLGEMVHSNKFELNNTMTAFEVRRI